MPTNPKGEGNIRRCSTPGPRVTVLVLLAATLILALSCLAEAKAINANSVSQSDVAAAIASAADGDIVIVPSGTVAWSRTLSVKKAVELRGAGVGSTIIKDNVQSGPLINWDIRGNANQNARLTGIEFQNGGRSAFGYVIKIVGSNTNGATFRFDNNKWNNVNGVPVFDTVIGVVDHNSFEESDEIRVYGTFWNGQNWGDGSWAAPTDYGSSKWLFIEDNSFTQGTGAEKVITDAYAGARFVVRYNTIYNCYPTNHGTESTGRARGCRAMDVYNNTYTGTNLNNYVGGSRSGGVLFHDNQISGYTNGARFATVNYRNIFPFVPFGAADGVNPWDVNEPNAFFTGTAAQNSSGTTVTVSGNPNWPANKWVGYTIRRLSNLCNADNHLSYGMIQSNTANTISYTGSMMSGVPDMSFCKGDSLEIRMVEHAMDQVGRALGSLVAGDPPVRPTAWNDQVTEPCYSWNNTNGYGGFANFTEGSGVRANVHFFNNKPMPGYTPYTYPHPLVNGRALPLLRSPAATRNATANSQDHARKQRRPWGGKKPERKQTKKVKGTSTSEMPENQEKLGN